jgi:hypothetical protein
MKGLQRFHCALLVMALLTLGAWDSVSADAGPIIKMRAESEFEVDLGMIVEDFAPSLIEIAGVEDENAPEAIRALMGVLGVTALDRLNVRSSVNDERNITSLMVTLDPSADGGLLGDLFAVPPGEFGFGRYLEEDEVVLVVFASGLEQRIRALENLFRRPEVRQLAPMVPTDPLGITAMWGIDAEKDILPLLSGELDLILFPCSEGQECSTPGAALVLGLTDGSAFRETLLTILTKVLGEEQGEQMRAVEGEPAGDFTFYPMWEGLAYAIGPDFGIMTSDPDRLKEVVSRGKGGFPDVEATTYVRLSGDLLLTMLGSVVETADPGSQEAVLIGELLRSVGEETVGTIEVTSRTGRGQLDLDLRIPASLYAAEYRLLKEFFAIAPELAAINAKLGEEDLRGIVGEVDAALTRYGEQHEATFPESLDGLVEGGYLDAVPDLQPTPLGEYVDAGYTYLPLRDENGEVVGYYFFVYGVDENAGYDVFTSENLTDTADFRVAKDGNNDGVVGFSYDGVAIEHVEEWGRDGD